MMTLREESLKIHKLNQGKLGIYSKVDVSNTRGLSLAYSPGVADPCIEIFKDEYKVYD